MNEKAVFFFPGYVFFSGLQNWMNEWHVNFSVEKKKHKNHTKMREKKNTTNFVKKNGFPQNPDEWPMNFSRNRKKSACIFFFPLRGKKKKQHFGIWMNEWPVNFSGEKKNTIPLGQMHENSVFDAIRYTQFVNVIGEVEL